MHSQCVINHMTPSWRRDPRIAIYRNIVNSWKVEVGWSENFLPSLVKIVGVEKCVTSDQIERRCQCSVNIRSPDPTHPVFTVVTYYEEANKSHFRLTNMLTSRTNPPSTRMYSNNHSRNEEKHQIYRPTKIVSYWLNSQAFGALLLRQAIKWYDTILVGR